jgi:hypothetical protein
LAPSKSRRLALIAVIVVASAVGVAKKTGIQSPSKIADSCAAVLAAADDFEMDIAPVGGEH